MGEIEKKSKKKTPFSSAGIKILIYTLLGLAAITTIFPYLWMVLASFKTGIEISTYPERIFPKNPNFTAYRRANEKRTVRRNVSLPSWLNVEAERAGINVSAVLQTALKQELHIAE